MQLSVLLMVAFMVFFMGVEQVLWSKNKEITDEVKQTQKEVDQVRSFALAAKIYMENTAFPPTGKITWSSIKSTAPAGIKYMSFPDSWYVGRNGSGQWSLCLDVSSNAANVLVSSMPIGSQQVFNVNGFMVIGETSVASAGNVSSLCQ